MTYIDQINAFWMEHRKGAFNASEIAFFFVLLAEFNTAGWPAKLPVSNVLLCGLLGCSANMIRSSRDRLKQRGVIDFGQARSKREHTVYRLTLIKVARKGRQTHSTSSGQGVNNSAIGCGIGFKKSTQSGMESVTQSGTQPDYIRKEEEEEEKRTPYAPLAASRRRREVDPVKAEAQREFSLREKRKRLEDLRNERALIAPNPAAAEISELYAAQERAKDAQRQHLSKRIRELEGQISALETGDMVAFRRSLSSPDRRG